MTSYTSPRAFRLNISRFYENFSYHHKEEYHLLDEKIKAFFSSIIEGFVHEPLHFWFFKTHNYPYTKKQKLTKVHTESGSNRHHQFKFRLIDMSSIPEVKLRKNLSPFINIEKQMNAKLSHVKTTSENIPETTNQDTVRTFSPFIFVRKHILRALFAPGLLKLNRLPFNISSVKALHSYYLTYKGQQYLNRKQKSKPLGLVKNPKSRKKTSSIPEFLRSKHRLYLTYRNHLRNSNPVILGTCKVLKSTGIIGVQLSYYLDLDQTYTSEMSTILVYRLLASKKYLERVLNLKIKLSLINYFIFIWKYNLFNQKKLQLRSSLVSLFSTANEISPGVFSSAEKKLHSRSEFFSRIKLDELFKQKSIGLNHRFLKPIGVRYGLLKALSELEFSKIALYKSLYNSLIDSNLSRFDLEKAKRNYIPTIQSLRKIKLLDRNQVRAAEEEEFFMDIKEDLEKISTRLSRWHHNRFYKRTYNLIISLFFLPFDAQLLGNLISFELQNLRKGHGRYLFFLKTLFRLIFAQEDIRLYRSSPNMQPLINSILIRLKGRITKSRRPSTRTQKVSIYIASAKEQRPILVSLGKEEQMLSELLLHPIGNLAEEEDLFNDNIVSIYILSKMKEIVKEKMFSPAKMYAHNSEVNSLDYFTSYSNILSRFLLQFFKHFILYYQSQNDIAFLTQAKAKGLSEQNFRELQVIFKFFDENQAFFNDLGIQNLLKSSKSLDFTMAKTLKTSKDLISYFECLLKLIFLSYLKLLPNQTEVFAQSKQLQQQFWNFFLRFLKLNNIPFSSKIAHDQNYISALFFHAISTYKQKDKLNPSVFQLALESKFSVLPSKDYPVFNDAITSLPNNTINSILAKQLDTHVDFFAYLNRLQKSLVSKKLQINNPRHRLDSVQTVSYNRFGIINIEVVVFFNH